MRKSKFILSFLCLLGFSATTTAQQTHLYAPISLSEIESGVPFIIAKDAERSLVATTLYNDNSIHATSTESSYFFYHAEKTDRPGYYKLVGENGLIIGLTDKKASTDIIKDTNPYWKFVSAADPENGQFKIINYSNINSESQRFISFSGDVVKYYTEYGADGIPYLLKRVPKEAGSFTISESGYATYYTDQAFIMPEGVTGGYVTEEIESLNAGEAPTYKLSYNWAYTPGKAVPAFTPIVLRADNVGTGKEYIYQLSDTQDTAPQKNMLHGSLTDELTNVPGDNYYYQLSYNNDDEKVLGFWWAADNGGVFTNTAHKAYLAIPKDHAYENHALGFDIGGITAIAAPQERPDARPKAIYTLDGRRVAAQDINQLSPGFYIIDGRKALIRQTIK